MVCLKVSSRAAIACPELYPGAVDALSCTDWNWLKRMVNPGPLRGSIPVSVLKGTISPVAFFT